MTVSHIRYVVTRKEKTPLPGGRGASPNVCRTEELLQRVGIGSVFRGLLVEIGDHLASRRRNRNLTLEDDVLSGGFLAVDPGVGVVIGTNGGSCQGNASEKSASARISEHFGAHRGVGGSFGIAAFGSGGGGSVRAQLDLAGKNGASATWIHDQEDEIRGFPAGLEAEAGTFKSHHGRSAPRTSEVFASATGHGAAAVTSSKDKCCLENRRVDDDAFRFVDQVLGNVIRNVHDFLDHGSAIFQAIGFLYVVCRSRQRQDSET